MWIGAAEGAGVGISIEQGTEANDRSNVECPGCRASLGERLRAAFFGSLPGLALGITSGALLSARAPTYGRVSLIQSAALGGILAGSLAAVALQWKPYGADWEQHQECKPDCKIVKERSLLDLTLPALVGLNVGLGAGLLGAYVPDQKQYGPSWTRVLLIDLATVAGAVGGGIAGCIAVDNCLLDYPTDAARAKSAMAALAGGALGLMTGVLVTRNVDQNNDPTPRTPTSVSTLTILPATRPQGGVVPLLSAIGAF
jgi:hypothetical protein